MRSFLCKIDKLLTELVDKVYPKKSVGIILDELPRKEDPWRNWKTNPVGNALALLAVLAYTVLVVVIILNLRW